MDRAQIHEGIRRMRFADVLGRSERSELSQMEAAELLGISERTARNHVSTIFSKLGVNKRAQAIVRAREAGFGRTTGDPGRRG